MSEKSDFAMRTTSRRAIDICRNLAVGGHSEAAGNLVTLARTINRKTELRLQIPATVFGRRHPTLSVTIAGHVKNMTCVSNIKHRLPIIPATFAFLHKIESWEFHTSDGQQGVLTNK